MATHDQKDEYYDRFLQIFSIGADEGEKAAVDSDEEEDDEKQENKELQTMCIINDLHDLMVFYVYGSSVEFKRYKHQRYRAMNHFDKKKLHNFTRFAYKNNTGLVHETFKNIFINKKEENEDLTAHIVVK